MVGAGKHRCFTMFSYNVNMNLLNLISMNREGRHQAQSNKGRFFGKDLTNAMQNNASFKQDEVRKRPSSEYMNKKTKQPSKTEHTVLQQYHQQHLQTLLREETELTSNSLLGITNKMRSILVDWLVDVHNSFNLLQRTLHVAYRFLDAYLVLEETSKAELQLVGITCLWIASKYEEIYPPKLKVFVEVTANTYTAEQMLDMETKIMRVLGFNLVKPTSISFIDLFTIDSRTRSMATYLCELATLQGLSLIYKQSVISLAAISLGDSVFKTKHNLKGFSERVPPTQVIECFKELCRALGDSKHGLKALSKKYCQPIWHNVAKYRLEANENR